jgi:PAS domain S-box-containing protein
MSDLRETDPALRELRQRAERQASEEGPGSEGLSPVEAARLVHELRVHQIELEMQNDELRQTQARLEESRGQYANLYDFAPMGYLTLDGPGRVIEANLTAASLLGIERGRLLGRYFWLLLAEEDRKAFNRMLTNAQNLPKRRGEFRILMGQGEARAMLLNVIFTQDKDGKDIRRLSLTDISDLKKAQVDLEESREQLRRLARRMLAAQEQDRRRIARDLHDEMGQSLMALKMELNAVKRSFQRGEEPWKEFDQAINFIDVIVEQTRKICQALQPSALENLGLNGALRQLQKEFQRHHGLEVAEDLEELSDLLSPETQITVYRLFQECLTNAIRHGHATHVKVQAYKLGGKVCFVCEDNGIGFDPEELKGQEKRDQGLGLVAMAERIRLLQGTFEISSIEGTGTRIHVTLPPDKKPL